MKQVRETVAGKSISAWVVLKKGNHVATVHAHYSDCGRVQVDVWHCCTVKDGTFPALQQGSASGYGYDKFTAALAGLKICGVVMTDHCGTNDGTKALLARYHAGKISEDATKRLAAKIGAQFANWDTERNRWESLYIAPGLDRLAMMGYDVIKAI